MAYEPAVTNARMNAPGNVMYAIWDANYRKHLLGQEPVKARQMLDGLEERVEQSVISGEYVSARWPMGRPSTGTMCFED